MQPRHARVSVPPGAPAEIRFTRWLATRETLVVEPVGSYVICCVQRTTSWLLAHTLADTGHAGQWALRPDQGAGGASTRRRADRAARPAPRGVRGTRPASDRQ